MKCPVTNLDNKTIGEIDLADEVFALPVRKDILARMVNYQLNKRRTGNHKTKQVWEVSGTTKKPYKQKGTGRARQGSRRAAQWVGGGRIHTPHPRSYEQRMPKKMRQAALRSALSAKAAEAEIVIVDDLKLNDHKTRLMVSALTSLVGNASVLVVMPEKDQAYETVMRSADNLEDAKVLLAGYLNIRDLFTYDKLVLPVKTLDALVANLG